MVGCGFQPRLLTEHCCADRAGLGRRAGAATLQAEANADPPAPSASLCRFTCIAKLRGHEGKLYLDMSQQRFYTNQERVDTETTRISNPNVVGSGYIHFGDMQRVPPSEALASNWQFAGDAQAQDGVGYPGAGLGVSEEDSWGAPQVRAPALGPSAADLSLDWRARGEASEPREPRLPQDAGADQQHVPGIFGQLPAQPMDNHGAMPIPALHHGASPSLPQGLPPASLPLGGPVVSMAPVGGHLGFGPMTVEASAAPGQPAGPVAEMQGLSLHQGGGPAPMAPPPPSVPPVGQGFDPHLLQGASLLGVPPSAPLGPSSLPSCYLDRGQHTETMPSSNVSQSLHHQPAPSFAQPQGAPLNDNRTLATGGTMAAHPGPGPRGPGLGAQPPPFGSLPQRSTANGNPAPPATAGGVRGMPPSDQHRPRAPMPAAKAAQNSSALGPAGAQAPGHQQPGRPMTQEEYLAAARAWKPPKPATISAAPVKTAAAPANKGKDGQKPKEWGCARCSFINPGHMRFCEMCSYDRVSGTGERSAPDDGWVSSGHAPKGTSAGGAAAGPDHSTSSQPTKSRAAAKNDKRRAKKNQNHAGGAEAKHA